MTTPTLLIWTGTVAVLANYLGVVRAGDAKSRTVALATALLFWAAFTVSAYQVTFVTSGIRTTISMPTYAYLGLVGGATTLVLLFKSAFEVITESGAPDATTGDMEAIR